MTTIFLRRAPAGLIIIFWRRSSSDIKAQRFRSVARSFLTLNPQHAGRGLFDESKLAGQHVPLQLPVVPAFPIHIHPVSSRLTQVRIRVFSYQTQYRFTSAPTQKRFRRACNRRSAPGRQPSHPGTQSIFFAFAGLPRDAPSLRLCTSAGQLHVI
jgi:hypothetical protein